jgi:hypothetical protein
MLKKTIAVLSAMGGAIAVASAAYAYDASKADTERVDKLEAYTKLTFDELNLEKAEHRHQLLVVIPDSVIQPYQKLQRLELETEIGRIKRRMNRIN